MKKYHIGYSSRVGEINNPQAQWQDLGWTTARDLHEAAKNVLIRYGLAAKSVDKVFMEGRIRVFEIVENQFTGGE